MPIPPRPSSERMRKRPSICPGSGCRVGGATSSTRATSRRKSSSSSGSSSAGFWSSTRALIRRTPLAPARARHGPAGPDPAPALPLGRFCLGATEESSVSFSRSVAARVDAPLPPQCNPNSASSWNARFVVSGIVASSRAPRRPPSAATGPRSSDFWSRFIGTRTTRARLTPRSPSGSGGGCPVSAGSVRSAPGRTPSPATRRSPTAARPVVERKCTGRCPTVRSSPRSSNPSAAIRPPT